MNHAFGQARGAGGVHDVEHVVGAGGDVGFVIGGGVAEGAIRLGEVRRFARAFELQPLVNVGAVAAGMQVGHELREVVVEDEPGGTGVLEDELQLIPHQPPVERHHHGADLAEREERLDELGAVHHEQAHPLALADAGAKKGIRHPVRAQVQLLEVEPLPRVAVHIRLPLRRQKRPLREPPTNVVFHATSPLGVERPDAAGL